MGLEREKLVLFLSPSMTDYQANSRLPTNLGQPKPSATFYSSSLLKSRRIQEKEFIGEILRILIRGKLPPPKTDSINFFERASLICFYRRTTEAEGLITQSGVAYFESGKIKGSVHLIG